MIRLLCLMKMPPSASASATVHLRRRSFCRVLTLALWLVLAFLASGVAFAGPPESTSLRLLIVAPREFHPALADFVAFKTRRLSTSLLALEDILKTAPGVDDPEKLKRFLYAQWKGPGLNYVLLVGDIDKMPVRYMVLDRATPAAFDYAFYPSDLYYADLAKADGSFEDWNAQKQSFHAGYYGEVRGEKNKQDPINYDQIHYLPEVAVGRWPVSTREEVRRVAQKTIRFETSSAGGTGTNAARASLIAVGGWVDSRQAMDGFATKLKGWQTEKCYYRSPGHETEGPPPSHERVRALFDAGSRLVLHAGHGQSDAWEQCFSLRDLDQLSNSNQLSIVLSAGCSTAYFAPLAPYDAYVDREGHEHAGTDHQEVFTAPPPPAAPYQHGRFNPTGLGEQFLKRGPNGAVAYIGCNTGSQPCGLTLQAGFVDALSKGGNPRLGDCWSAALRYYFETEHLATLKPNDDWYPPSIFFQGMKFMLFGDPSLPVLP